MQLGQNTHESLGPPLEGLMALFRVKDQGLNG
jgi:hypothetical protein